MKADPQYCSLSLFHCKLVSYLRAVKRKKSSRLLVVFCSDCVRCNFPLKKPNFQTDDSPLH